MKLFQKQIVGLLKKKFSIIINNMPFCIANVLHNYTTNAWSIILWYDITQRYGVKLKGLGLSLSCVLFCKAKLGTSGLTSAANLQYRQNALSYFQCENLENFLYNQVPRNFKIEISYFGHQWLRGRTKRHRGQRTRTSTKSLNVEYQHKKRVNGKI